MLGLSISEVGVAGHPSCGESFLHILVAYMRLRSCRMMIEAADRSLTGLPSWYGTLGLSISEVGVAGHPSCGGSFFAYSRCLHAFAESYGDRSRRSHCPWAHCRIVVRLFSVSRVTGHPKVSYNDPRRPKQAIPALIASSSWYGTLVFLSISRDWGTSYPILFHGLSGSKTLQIGGTFT